MSNKRVEDGPSELAWFKSGYSSGEDGMCVEVAASPDTAHVRDSKHRHGPQLSFHIGQWDEFIGGLRAEEFGA
ncbi:DUF397 domain-containing protein [Streptomyces sp. NPDC005355]|uniref:DUF397 domain-containing protein n=1 Tax=Streptomyces sp. NPDC005355 TaxID=3157038 RepID=UPI00339DE760